jgi:hypothetical protein
MFQIPADGEFVNSLTTCLSHLQLYKVCSGWNAVQPYLTLRQVNKGVYCFIIFYYLGGNRTKLYIVCDVKAGKLVYCWVDKCGKVLKGVFAREVLLIRSITIDGSKRHNQFCDCVQI